MKTTTFALLLIGCAGLTLAQAQGLDPAIQSKVDAAVKTAQAWASDPVIVKAVKAHNGDVSNDKSAMTQDKWKSLSILDPVVRAYTKNEAGELLKAKKTALVTEAFLSGADGAKVAFLSKPSNWSHKGKPKHDVPMTGKTWQGDLEVDESTGQKQLQLAVPVLDGDKPIGSLVVGISLAKLE